MNIKNSAGKDLEMYEKGIYRIVNRYTATLNNKAAFVPKLTDLEILLIKDDYRISSGVCSRRFPCTVKLILFINPNISTMYNMFLIAHEMAHLLLINYTDLFNQCGLASDGSRNGSAIKRVLQDGREYGYDFEEMIANYIARFIVSAFDYDDRDGKYQKMLIEKGKDFDIVEKFAGIYGESIQNKEFIDGYELRENRVFFNNPFWTNILSYSFNVHVNEFDRVLGEHAFEKFCARVQYYNKASKENTKEYHFVRITKTLQKLKESTF